MEKSYELQKVKDWVSVNSFKSFKYPMMLVFVENDQYSIGFFASFSSIMTKKRKEKNSVATKV